MEDHLDNHPDDYEKSFNHIGRVTAVFPKDHPNNPTYDGETGITMYQVELHSQFPSGVYTLDFVPAAGQCTGGKNDICDPYLVGDWVTVSFIEGNLNLPEIARRRFSPLHNSTVDNGQSDYPQVNITRNGSSIKVDKEGNFEGMLAEGKSLKFKDSDGNVFFELIKTGGNYEFHAGGDSGLEKLIDERAADVFNDHGHVYAETGAIGSYVTSKPVTPGILPVASVPISAPTSIGSSHMTSVTKAK